MNIIYILIYLIFLEYMVFYNLIHVVLRRFNDIENLLYFYSLKLKKRIIHVATPILLTARQCLLYLQHRSTSMQFVIHSKLCV